MKHIKSFLRFISHWSWELPQTLLGFIVVSFYERKGGYTHYKTNNTVVSVISEFPGGISLGRYVLVSYFHGSLVKHELGHTKQSLWLGPLYLLVIGFPSMIWAGLKRLGYFKKVNYYWFYTESWAEKIKRDITL